MTAVLIAAYFVMLVLTIVSTYYAVHYKNECKELTEEYEDRQNATKQWAQKLVKDTDKKIEEAHAAVHQAGQEGFTAGRSDMLQEFKERVDRGEIDIKILSTPVQAPQPAPTVSGGMTASYPQNSPVTQIPVQ